MSDRCHAVSHLNPAPEPTRVESGSAFDVSRFADMLIIAHQTGRQLYTPDKTRAPPDKDAAYAIQTEVAGRLGSEVAGWKAALTPQGPVAAPIFRRLVSADNTVRPAQSGRVTGIEIELAIRLKHGVGQSMIDLHDESDLPEPAGELFVGMELIGGRFRDEISVPATAFLADNLGNAGYVLGEEIDRSQIADIGRSVCRVEIDGEVAFQGLAKHPNGDPLAPFRACLSNPPSKFVAFRAAQFVTTGSLCGLLPVTRPNKIEAMILGIGRVTCQFAWDSTKPEPVGGSHEVTEMG